MFRHVLMMMDFSASALAALHRTRTTFPDAQVTVVHVTAGAGLSTAAAVTPSGRGLETTAALALRAREWTDDATSRLKELGGGELVEGEPAEVALERARSGQYDLIVMGTSGKSGMERFLFGSVAQRVVRESPIPVLTYPAP